MSTKTEKEVKNNLPSWFKGEVYNEGDTVKNPFTGEPYDLTAEELSMYDLIKGAEFLISHKGGILDPATAGIQRDMRKGLDWFRANNAKAYMVLLD